MSKLDPKFSVVQYLDIDENHHNQRVDNYLLTLLKRVPKSHVYKLCRKGEVRVNKKRVKPDYRLQEGDIIRLAPVKMDEKTVKPIATAGLFMKDQILDSILYQDDFILVINKPSGLAVHGGSGISLGLIESLRQIFPEQRYLELVHRLDRDTSGVVLLAKKRSALTYLHECFRAKKVNKQYWCFVKGTWPNRVTLVDAPLKKNDLQGGERIVVVDEEGKSSQTRFRILKRYERYTWVEASPITGRTHQIRVHCASQGHPIIGDVKYCDEPTNKIAKSVGVKRLFLHAASLRFPHPDTRESMEIKAPLDNKLLQVLNNLPEKTAQNRKP
ncbi:23S rRNA pseudouridine(955/2504/2580) synthase RluC [Marinicellulosiphila megalodicopiae]|uniref:23S rRNA pseudouridine(955/2504/2580) synthase RluC n=1 Tax=Marinicellulosiphila megalodicopiae TaxID=2724896 RepID=UPI003BAE73BD